MPEFNTLFTFFNKSNSSFAFKLDINLNTVAKSYQIHLLNHNNTCYKYSASRTD